MEAYQEKIILEKNELKEKTDKLGSFILDNPVYQALEEEEKLLLNEQHFHMCNYLDILEKRIKKFKN